MMLQSSLFTTCHMICLVMLTYAGPAAGMPHKHPKALPTTASTATTPTAAGTPAATAAPERRSWFGRDRRAGADLGPAAAGGWRGHCGRSVCWCVLTPAYILVALLTLVSMHVTCRMECFCLGLAATDCTGAAAHK